MPRSNGPRHGCSDQPGSAGKGEVRTFSASHNSRGARGGRRRTEGERHAAAKNRCPCSEANPPAGPVKVNRLKVYFTLLLRLTLGLTFTMKFLERHEDALHERYRQMVKNIPPANKARFEAMMEEEEHQESYLMGEIHEGRVKYMSFIVLGLADALVEISGIHAGSLGIYAKTELAGLAGVVAGMAASIAMASAAYAQAKQGFEGSAKWSAIYTGVSYMFTAIFLALPYFLIRSMINALGISLIVGVTLVAAMTYYDTVISARKFTRQFGEIAGIILAASFALYIAGTLIRQLLGIVIG